MKRTVLIEGTFLLAISIISIIEGLRLTIYKDPNMLYDIMGPGLYIFFVGIFLMIASIIYFIGNYKKIHIIKKIAINKEMTIRMISMIVVLVIYAFLINVVGYFFASIVFFLLEFRISGIKSWLITCILTLAFTAGYYIVFVQYCSMIFPRGIFFK